jgi:hypothetical protein
VFEVAQKLQIWNCAYGKHKSPNDFERGIIAMEIKGMANWKGLFLFRSFCF